jgi:MFS family permease
MTLSKGFGEKLGRKGSSYAGLAIMIIGAALQTSSFSLAQMIVGRIFAGIGMGTLAATLPMWAAEMVKPRNRGKLLSVLGSSIGFGIFFSYWFEYGLSYVSGPISWRLPVSLQMVFASISLVMLPFLPESPRWLIAHDRLEEAVAILAALESKDATEHTPAVVARRDEIVLALEIEQAQGPVRWRELFWNNEVKNRRYTYSIPKSRYRSFLTCKLFRRVILAIGISVFQQMSGVNALVYYIPYLLETTMGLSRGTSLWVSGLNGLVFFLASFYPVFFLDRYGRKKPFIIASASCAINMMMVAILLSINKQSTNYAAIGKIYPSSSIIFSQLVTNLPSSVLLYVYCHIRDCIHGYSIYVYP